MKVGSLFSGIGAFEKALTNIGIDFTTEWFCEIDKYAPVSYCAIHNEPIEKNLGDITKVDIESLPYVDLITHGSPCQDFSLAGLGKGGDKGAETRSSLMWNTVAIVGQLKPKYVIWENVKGVLGKKHRHNFDKYLDEMQELGYKNYAKVLNAKDYGVPQNRERIFVVSIRKDIDNGYRFPEAEPLKIRLKDVLEQEVDEKYYLSDESFAKLKAHNQRHAEKGNGFRARIISEKDTEEQVCTTIQTIMHRSVSTYIEGSSTFGATGAVVVREATKKGYAEASPGDSINIGQPNSKTRRWRVGKQIANTLTTQMEMAVVEPYIVASRGRYVDDGITEPTACERRMDEGLRFFKDGCVGSMRTIDSCGDKRVIYPDYRIRKLTPKECWRLMSFSDEDFNKAQAAGISNSQLYKQAGNSIVVKVLERIFENLLKGVE